MTGLASRARALQERLHNLAPVTPARAFHDAIAAFWTARGRAGTALPPPPHDDDDAVADGNSCVPGHDNGMDLLALARSIVLHGGLTPRLRWREIVRDEGHHWPAHALREVYCEWVAPFLAHTAPNHSRDAHCCSACLLPLADSMEAAAPAARGAPRMWTMPCCGATVHLDCVARCVRSRHITQRCTACLRPIAADTADAALATVDAGNESARQRMRSVGEFLSGNALLL